MVGNYWKEQCEKLEEKLKTSDCSDFLQWDFIKHNMFHEITSVAFEELKHSKYWEKWKEGIKEDDFGKPNRYYLYSESSGNLIHHAYSLMQLADFVKDFDPTKLTSIFEFGGGYGSWCRLLYHLGFNGEYFNYDLPVWLELQRKFLNNVGLINKKIVMFNPLPEEVTYNIDLFVSLWAISESPLEIREKVLSKITTNYFLIAFQKQFEGTDNIEYFTQLITRYNNYEWKMYEIPHLPGNYYLLGRKNG